MLGTKLIPHVARRDRRRAPRSPPVCWSPYSRGATPPSRHRPIRNPQAPPRKLQPQPSGRPTPHHSRLHRCARKDPTQACGVNLSAPVVHVDLCSELALTMIE
ncbi:hypothetical protein B0T21DRAFT_354025 [Apiosordaria backusii]|uniref:Uncharacterized protein n=1 Tax=Apiosordaria backusii TaxID=314023 RepID=A0AA40EXR9_9PEZI|nr:hypothetical protein B0T21DRAFT_354025 [Apiosordaria backusii]